MSGLTVGDFLDRKGASLSLEVLTGEEGLGRPIPGPDISSPGLVLSGYTERFPGSRIQVLGETEVSYLRSLAPGERQRAVATLLGFDVPCLVVTKAMDPPRELLEAASASGTPLLRSGLKTGEFYRRIKPYLEDEFAPRTAVHGSVADVYGVGLLFVGKSGIGKSECVLDLIERGHRLVADDVVIITRRGNDVLIGRGHRAGQAPHGDPGHGHHRHSRPVRRARDAAAEARGGRRAARGVERAGILRPYGARRGHDRNPGGAAPQGPHSAQSRKEHHRDLARSSP